MNYIVGRNSAALAYLAILGYAVYAAYGSWELLPDAQAKLSVVWDIGIKTLGGFAILATVNAIFDIAEKLGNK